jgi:hypothetical protein
VRALLVLLLAALVGAAFLVVEHLDTLGRPAALGTVVAVTPTDESLPSGFRARCDRVDNTVVVPASLTRPGRAAPEAPEAPEADDGDDGDDGAGAVRPEPGGVPAVLPGCPGRYEVGDVVRVSWSGGGRELGVPMDRWDAARGAGLGVLALLGYLLIERVGACAYARRRAKG